MIRNQMICGTLQFFVSKYKKHVQLEFLWPAIFKYHSDSVGEIWI